MGDNGTQPRGKGRARWQTPACRWLRRYIASGGRPCSTYALAVRSGYSLRTLTHSLKAPWALEWIRADKERTRRMREELGTSHMLLLRPTLARIDRLHIIARRVGWRGVRGRDEFLEAVLDKIEPEIRDLAEALNLDGDNPVVRMGMCSYGYRRVGADGSEQHVRGVPIAMGADGPEAEDAVRSHPGTQAPAPRKR